MTLEERIAALEAQAAANQLPASMAVLKRKLEQDWQPDANVLLQPGSITAEMLGEARGVSVAGVGTGATFVDIVVTDGLGTTSKFGLATHYVPGGTHTADGVVPLLLSTATNTTTFRCLTRKDGVIAIGLTVFINYRIWKA